MRVVHITILTIVVMTALSVRAEPEEDPTNGYFDFDEINQALEKRRPARTRQTRCLGYGKQCTVNYFGAHNCCFQTRCTGARGMPCKKGKSCVCAHYNGK